MTSSDQSCNRKKLMWTGPCRFSLVFLGFQKLKDWSWSQSMALGVKKLDWTGLPNTTKEKKTARLLEALQTWAIDQSLGEEAMLGMSLEDIEAMFQKSESEMIKSVGGQQKW